MSTTFNAMSRRQVLRLLGLSGAAALAAACSQAAPAAPTTAAPKPTTAPAPAASPAAAASPSPAAKPAASPSAAASPAAAAKPAQAAPAATSLTRVQVGMIGSTSDAGFFIADERGYFKEAGVDFQIVQFQSGVDMVAPAGNGQLDVATGAPNAGLFNAIARGVPLKIVADKGAQLKGFIYSSFVVDKGLLDSGEITSWADFKGRKISGAGVGNTGQLFLDRAMHRGGLTWKDADMVTLSYADLGAALTNHSVAGGVAIEPFRTQWPEQGIGKLMPDDDEIYVNQQAAVVMFGPKFATEQTDLARRLIVAYLRGARDYSDAFIKKQGRDAVIDVLVKRTSLKDRALYDKIGVPAINPNGDVLFDDLVYQQDWYVDNGYQTQKIDMKAAVDPSFAQYAVQQLGGRYVGGPYTT